MKNIGWSRFVLVTSALLLIGCESWCPCASPSDPGCGPSPAPTVAPKVDPVPGGVGTATISFTYVPPRGSTSNLRGTVLHALPADHKVFCWIKVSGGWWPKPTFTEPFTAIKADGSWECDITTGGDDQLAVEVRAYLVTKNFSWIWPRDTAMPSVNGADVLAVVIAER